MRALPARSKPAIKLGEDVYATDGQFIRDSAYRAIQWGLWKRLSYRDEWIKRQGQCVEEAYPKIFGHQLQDAETFKSVYYKDAITRKWVECDLLMSIDDVLLVIECKAGVMPMHSPATDFARYARVIDELIGKAYQQCARFIEYLASAPEVALYALRGGAHVEIARVKRNSFRLILPIGLTSSPSLHFQQWPRNYRASAQSSACIHLFLCLSMTCLSSIDSYRPLAN